MEERLERMEEMLANLIRMVGEMKKDQLEMKQDIGKVKEEIIEVKQDQKAMREELAQMREGNEKHYHETNTRFFSIEIDHEHTWEKAVQNERELSKLKKQFDLKDFT